MMELKYLGRDEAPIKPETWKLLDSTMVDAAKTVLAGRRLLNIEGPYGLGLKAVPLEDCAVSECLLVSQFVPVHMISTTFNLGVRDLIAYEQNGLPFAAAPLSMPRSRGPGWRTPSSSRGSRDPRAPECPGWKQPEARFMECRRKGCGRCHPGHDHPR